MFDFSDLNKPKLIKYDSSQTKIFFYKEQRIYQKYYHWNEVDTAGNSLQYEFRSNFFVYSIGKSQGLFYDNHKKISSKKVSVDSILAKQWAYKPNFIDLLSIRLISSSWNTTLGELEELYSFKGKKDTSMKGRVFFTFCDIDKFRKIDYSFSNELDSIKSMKLYKVFITYDARYVEYASTYMEKVEVPYLLEKIPVDNEEEIMKLLKAEKTLVIK